MAVREDAVYPQPLRVLLVALRRGHRHLRLLHLGRGKGVQHARPGGLLDMPVAGDDDPAVLVAGRPLRLHLSGERRGQTPLLLRRHGGFAAHDVDPGSSSQHPAALTVRNDGPRAMHPTTLTSVD